MKKNALKMILLLFAAVLSGLSVVIPQCQPPNDCSVHVFSVRLSQKPETEDLVENTTYKAVRNSEYGANYYEIRGGQEMTPKLAAEIIQSMGENADPRLKEKINNKEFFWKAVEAGGEQIVSHTLPPPSPPPKKVWTSTPSSSFFKDFPFLLVTFLICVGVFLGVLLTAFCFFMTTLQKQPQFDRSSAVIYSKVSEAGTELRPMLRGDHQHRIEMMRHEGMESASVAPSMSSAARIGPSWRNGNSIHHSSSRHISL